jgi:hypothetical protein
VRKFAIISAVVCLLLTELAGAAGQEPGQAAAKPSNRDLLAKIERPQGGFEVQAKGRASLKVGEALTFQISSAKPGYLWVLHVDPQDEVSLLLPNRLDQGNQIQAGRTMILPPPWAEWDIAAGEPLGQSLVAFIVTEEKLPLVKLIEDHKNLKEALDLLARSPSWGVAKLVVEVK